MSSARSVLVVGHYGAGNVGDEAVLSGALALLADVVPGAVVEVVSSAPEETARGAGVRALAIDDRAALLAALRRCDLVVLGGGGPLFDYGGLEPGSLLGGETWSAYYWLPAAAAALGVPVVMLGQGVGPLAGAGGREAVGALARSLTAMAVRDDGSRDLLGSLGVDPRRLEVTADLAFAAPELAAAQPLPGPDAPYAVVSVRDPVLADGPDALPALGAALASLHASTGLRSLLVPFQVRGVDDRVPSRRLLDELSPEVAVGMVDGDDQTPLRQSAAAVAGASLVVGMRLHSVVFALALGVPVVALSYDPKVRALMHRVGLLEQCLDVDGLTSQQVDRAVAVALEGGSERSRAAGDRLREEGVGNRAVLRRVVDGAVQPPVGRGLLDAVREQAALALDRVPELERRVGVLEGQRQAAEERHRALESELRRQHLEREVALGEARAAAERERSAREALAEREQQAADVAASHDELARLRDDVDRVAGQLGRISDLLRREEVSVLRPVLRRAYRFGRRAGGALPPSSQERVRAALAPVAARLAPRSAQTAAYQQAQRARRSRAGSPPAAPSPAGGLPRTAGPALRGRAATLPPGAPGAFDVVVLPVIDWHFRVQRPQHLSSQLAARGHRVVYLTTELAAPASGQVPYEVLEQPAPGVWTARLTCPPPLPRIYTDALTPAQADAVAAALRQLKADLGLDRTVLLAHHPFWEPVMRASHDDFLLYDLIDDHEGFEGTAAWVLEAEQRLLQEVDLVTVTAPTLAEKAPGAVLVRNAADVARFAARPASVRSSGRPVVGYFGAIAHWFDSGLVARCARAHPEWDVVLIGSTFGADVTELESLPNVHLLGERPYDELPEHLHGFDVCLIPFHVIPLTTHTNPVKAYEYLAAGKPVVATAMPEVVLMQPHVHVADGAERFLAAVERAMGEVGDDDLARTRQAWAAQHTWTARVQALEAAVEQRLPAVSVVVLCYNNLVFTQACLESLERHTRYPDWELVIVDNGSTDGTPEHLRAYAQDRPHVRLVLNESNRGFAGGNNDGLAAARGDVLVLLNNDTYVTDGWLLGLVRHLRDDPGLGLVGPVTNNIGNEARVPLEYDGMTEMAERAREYTSSRFRRLVPVATVAFFCVAMRREVYEEVGGLDEDFGVGFFEDDDYCRRVTARGFDVAVADDVFVHHHLSASFDALGARRRAEQFDRSRVVYERKWGPWTPHAYRSDVAR